MRIKKLVFIVVAFALWSCSDNNSNFKKFDSVKEVLLDAGDFNENQGTLKFISNAQNNIHVQVSSFTIESDLDEIKMEEVKRNIVLVAYQCFAKTNVNTIMITSIPYQMNTGQTAGEKYLDEYAITVKVNRESALETLKGLTESQRFSELYELNKSLGFWTPSRSFKVLKYDKLEEAIAGLIEK